MKVKIDSVSEEFTKELGSKIASLMFKGSLILLTGDLGAGKTTFTKGLAKGLNILDEVNSPTFNILKCYFNKPLNLYHIDAYRLEGVNSENKNIGLEEVIEGDGVCVIEWPMYIKEFIPSFYLNINITLNEDNSRTIEIESFGKKYDEIVNKLEEIL